MRHHRRQPSTGDRRREWTGPELGAALAKCVTTLDPGACVVGNEVVARAVHRDGKGPTSLHINVARGVWKDFARDDGGGVKDFAARLDQDLVTFLRTWAPELVDDGRSSRRPSTRRSASSAAEDAALYEALTEKVTSAPAPSPPPAPAPATEEEDLFPDVPRDVRSPTAADDLVVPWAPDQAAKLFGILVRDESDEATRAVRTWLIHTRGFGDSIMGIESGFGAVGASSHAFFERARWPSHRALATARIIRHRGNACVAPLRSARTNMIENIAFRFLDVKEKKDRLIPLKDAKLTDADGAPRAYGWCGAALRTPVLILVEGMVDCFAAESFVCDTNWCAVGAHSVGQISKAWTPWLAQRHGGLVVVVPHLDDDGGRAVNLADGAGQRASIALVATLGDRARLFSWSVFYGALRDGGLADPSKVVRDLSDALKHLPWATVRDSFMRALPAEVRP